MKIKALISSFLLMFCMLSHAEPININTANIEALSTTLSGIGTQKAADIVEYRSKNGNFKSVDDLTHVKGIGSKTIERNRDKMTVGTQEEEEPVTPPNQ